MTKRLYVVRHCQADGQESDAPLTAEGRRQAQVLADFLAGQGIRRIISSPFVRAHDSIVPLTQRIGISVQTDARLTERVLSERPLPDWYDRLRDTFEDMDLALAGGESNRAAMERAVTVVNEVLRDGVFPTVIVTHGNLMTLLLKHFDDRFGFSEWQKLTTPDVFRVTLEEGHTRVDRLWE